MLKNDHLTMLNSKEFGSVCVNSTQNQTLNIIKTDAFVEITSEGLPIIETTPMFNTSLKHLKDGILINTVIKQNDILVIDGISYLVREVRNDGIGGIDIYLKG